METYKVDVINCEKSSWILIQFYFQTLGRSLVQGSGLCMVVYGQRE